MKRCADAQLIDGDTLAAVDTLVIDIQFISSGQGEVLAVLVGMIGRAARELDTVQHGNGVFLTVDSDDLKPAAITHSHIKAIGKRDGRRIAEIQQGSIDARSFGSAGARAGYHRPITFDVGDPAGAVDIEIGEKPAFSLQIALYFRQPDAGTGIEIVDRSGGGGKKRLEKNSREDRERDC